MLVSLSSNNPFYSLDLYESQIQRKGREWLRRVKNLSELGFTVGVIFETIVSTYDENMVANAAPMGVTTFDMERLMIRPFTDTLTYRNMMISRSAAVNITSDPILYYTTVFKSYEEYPRLLQDWFEPAESVKAPRLKEAEAYIEVLVEDVIKESIDHVKIICRVEKILSKKNLGPKAYCRADSALIESVIHATRVKAFLEQGRLTEADRLVKLIEHYDQLTEKVAANSPMRKYMNQLIRRVRDWRSRFEG